MTEMGLLAATDAIVPVEPRYLETVGLLSVISKLGVHSRDAAIQRAAEVGWTTIPPISAGTFAIPVRLVQSRLHLINALPQDVIERYVGREREADELIRILRAKARLMSMYGRSGIGKTALASKVLADLLQSDGPPDGLVSFGAPPTGISLPQVLTCFARLLGGTAEECLTGMAQDGQVSAAAKIIVMLEYLRQGWYILLLDNLETLQAADTGELTDHDLYLLFQIAIEQGGLSIFITSQT
jgi:Cdc6-like AAA superfamily ATPase